MTLSAIALDFDGTIAAHDRLDSSVRAAIATVRSRGILVLLVTGRILERLRSVVGDLHFVDGVVAENGGVLHFPANEYTTLLAPPVPAAFLDELKRRGIGHDAGQCLVDAATADAAHLLDVIQKMELPLTLVFNGGRVMTLPQGCSKATGLQAALDTLRISPHNVVAVGDAENDHALLRLAGIGAAVAWGSSALRAAADLEIAGAGPPAVAPFLLALAASGRMPVPVRARRTLRLGYGPDGSDFSLGVRGRNILIAGDAKSGKSWVTGLLCEQLILLGLCVCVIDPEGDYCSLEGLPGVSVMGGDDPPPTGRELARALRFPDRSLVIDLSRRPQDEKIEYTRETLPVLNALRRRAGFPHRVVLDEAHYVLHDADALKLLDLENNGYLFVSYWASRLPPELVDSAEVILVTRESSPAEIAALRARCSTCGSTDAVPWSLLGHLPTGHAAALPVTSEAGGALRQFSLGPRLTPHVRHREKYVDVPVSAARGFYFVLTGVRATTLRQFVEEIERAAPEALVDHMRRHDFSRWIRHVFGDHPLAVEIERLEATAGEGSRETPEAEIASAIRRRYEVGA